MSKLPKFRWNWKEFCGTENFTIWTENHLDLTQCFQTVCLQIPLLFAIAIVSAYFAGKYETWTIRTSREKHVIKLRMAVVLCLTLLPPIRIITQIVHDPKIVYEVNYLFTILESITWFVHFIYVAALRNRLGSSLRGPLISGCLYATFYVICVIRAKSIYMIYINDESPEAWIFLTFAWITLVMQTLYGLTLIPSEDSPSRRATIDAIDQNDIQQASALSRYYRFREDFDPFYIGVAMEGSGFMSRFFFYWVNSLMDKGADGQINNAEDVFELPQELTSVHLHNKLRNVLDTPECEDPDAQVSRTTLLKALHKCFAKEFYGVGILKFIADLASFASPLLLHQLMIFIDDLSVPVPHGYLYGAGIFLASFVGAMCSVHFDFFIGKISLKLQGALMTRIYRKILVLNASEFTCGSVGEIINLISTDMNRIANTCISFHAVWSIPFQLIVTLFLLYTQVGVAFVAGVIFSLILIPINKVITMKIGDLSTRMMAEKDKRVEMTGELLKGIRVIKLHVWEEYFVNRILGIRVKELKYLKGRKYLDALCVYFWATTPVIISIMTFTIHVYRGGELSAAIVFTTISLLNMLIVPLNAFPWVLNGVIEAWVSYKRVNSYLLCDEVNTSTYYTPKSDDTKALIIKNGVFSWNLNEYHLNNINLSIPKGYLVGIIGPVGSGKSSLLAAILGEIQGIKGFVSKENVNEGVGYVPQTLWIQQTSVRDNILFGRPFDAAKYRSVVQSCALEEDFHSWPDGDLEQVGEGGSTLSGGQKARIALARAVYHDKSVYVMDDVLSAVDTQVAIHIYNECLRTLLRGRTRILVTHFTQLLDTADWIVRMEDGRIVAQGPPSEILQDNEISFGIDQNFTTTSTETTMHTDDASDKRSDEERKEKGVVSLSVYVAYWKYVGSILVLLILISVVAMQVSRHAVDWWISLWVSVNTDARSGKNEYYYLTALENSMVRDHTIDVYYFLSIYIALGVINSVIVIIRAFLFAYGGVRAAKRIHKSLLSSVVQAHVEFFDVSPLGRLLNRFSSDTNTVDDALPFDINILLAQFCAVVGTICMTVYGIPWLCLILAPLVPVYVWLQNHYRLTSRELKRLGSVALSPLYSHVSETRLGIMTIRAFNETRRFIADNEDRIDTVQKCNLSSLAATTWLNSRLQLIGVVVIGGVCAIAVLQRHFDVSHSGFVGLAISYALTLTGSLGGFVNIFAETEQKMVAMERVEEYIKKPKSESENAKVAISLPYQWPYQGLVSFINVSLKYRDDIGYALKNVNFEVHSGEKIGIVGRTGAGKSSLFATLFRLVEVTEGVINIDAVNIANVPLRKLRSSITIIPQDPFIFAGSIRENIDPMNQYEDIKVWKAINKCNLVSLVERFGDLNGHLESGGRNISAGERQLLCLARAVLRNTKIVCVDEATSNMDQDTDTQIQSVLRDAFKNSTVFIIAHRVQSVMKCDRILLMSRGEVMEFDSPQNLLEDENSHFYQFINQGFIS